MTFNVKDEVIVVEHFLTGQAHLVGQVGIVVKPNLSSISLEVHFPNLRITHTMLDWELDYVEAGTLRLLAR